MALTYDELVEKYNKETLDFHGITKWHDAGYKGQGYKILNLEGLTDHGKGTLKMIKLISSESDISWCQFTIRCTSDKLVQFHAWTEDGDYTYEEFKEYLKDVDIVTLSKGGGLCPELEDYLLNNCICFTSAGNEGEDGLSGAFNGRAIDVGAIEIRNGAVHRERYSSYDCDFVFLHGAREGTSFSSPANAGAMAVILSRYNTKLTHDEAFKVLIEISSDKDLGEPGFDEKFGYGRPLLPEDFKIKILEEEPPPVEPPIEEPPIEEGGNKGMRYTVTFAHLRESKVYAGQLVNKGEMLGIAGDSGEADGIHMHHDVVEGTHYERTYTLDDIYYERGVKGSREQANYFVDDDFFKSPYVVTVTSLGVVVKTGQSYYDLYKRHHFSAIDWTNKDRLAVHRKFYWNRTFTGRVTYSGYNRWYGNHVMITYDTLDFEPPNNKEEPEEVKNDLSVTGSLFFMKYNHSNLKNIPKTIFYPPTDVVPDRRYRYMKIHPYNVGIYTKEAGTSDFEYAGANLTFFWWSNGETYPTSILVTKNKIHRGVANHYADFGTPQSVLCYYRDGTFGVEKIKRASELFVDNDSTKSSRVWWAVGGIGLISKYGYDPASEGFKKGISNVTGKEKDFTDTLDVSKYISVGVDTEGMVYVVRHYMVDREETISHLEEIGCVLAVGYDGGSSVQMITPKWEMRGGRKVDNSIMAIDLLV